MQNLGVFGYKDSFFFGILLKVFKKKHLLLYWSYSDNNQSENIIEIIFEFIKLI